MSKKSRKRNKKLLAMLALAGGAAMMGRGKGAASTVGQPVGVNRMSTNTPPIGGTDHIIKKAPVDNVASAAADSGPVLNVTGGIHAGRPAKGMLIKQRALNAGNRVPPSMRSGAQHAEGYQKYVAPNRQWPGGYIGAKTGGRIGAKKGGRVTGIAKRGFGRALMKGKK